MSKDHAQGKADGSTGKPMAPRGTMSSAEYTNYVNSYNGAKKK